MDENYPCHYFLDPCHAYHAFYMAPDAITHFTTQWELPQPFFFLQWLLPNLSLFWKISQKKDTLFNSRQWRSQTLHEESMKLVLLNVTLVDTVDYIAKNRHSHTPHSPNNSQHQSPSFCCVLHNMYGTCVCNNETFGCIYFVCLRLCEVTCTPLVHGFLKTLKSSGSQRACLFFTAYYNLNERGGCPSQNRVGGQIWEQINQPFNCQQWLIDTCLE